MSIVSVCCFSLQPSGWHILGRWLTSKGMFAFRLARFFQGHGVSEFWRWASQVFFIHLSRRETVVFNVNSMVGLLESKNEMLPPGTDTSLPAWLSPARIGVISNMFQPSKLLDRFLLVRLVAMLCCAASCHVLGKLRCCYFCYALLGQTFLV